MSLKRLLDPRLRRMVYDRSCRLCGRTGSLTGHHLVPRSRSGPDVPDNIVGLCEPCHKRVDSLDERVRNEARRSLRLALTAEEMMFVRGRMGKQYLDRHYPHPEWGK